MATFNNPILATTDIKDGKHSVGRVGFLTTRPDVNVVNAQYRQPGSFWAYYRPADGYAELYVVDPSGYRFMAIRG